MNLYGLKLEELKKYFENRKEIAFAFLFGSQAKGTVTSLSDVDIAIYFYPKKRNPIEFEKLIYYDTESEIYTDLTKILRKEVELLVLNKAPANISSSAIRGIPLAINDWGLYLDFMLVITDEAESYMDFIINDYKERN